MGRKVRLAPLDTDNAMLIGALAVAIDRAGGEMDYTQTEYAAIVARRGRYVLSAKVVRPEEDEPHVHLELEPAPARPGDVVN